MHNNDWSLIFFTLISQLSVGLSIFFCGFSLCASDKVLPKKLLLSFGKPSFLVLVLVFVATMLSFLHLGNPLNAINALNNIESSWLSREILAVLVFGFMVLLWFLFESRIIQGPRKLILFLTPLSGLTLIYVMSRIYMIPTIPSWSGFFTAYSFFNTGLVLGISFGLLYQIFIGVGKGEMQTKKYFTITLLVLVLVQILIYIIHYINYQKLMPQGMYVPNETLIVCAVGCIWSLVLSLIAASTLLILSFAFLRNKMIFWKYIYLFTVIILFIREFLLRYQFYAGYLRIGI